MNKASLVINTEEGLLAKDKALLIAQGLEKVIANGNANKSQRPTLILNYEPLLIQASSQDATFCTQVAQAMTCMRLTVQLFCEMSCLC